MPIKLLLIPGLFLLALCVATRSLYAQNLGFSEPVSYLAGARTDKAPDITHFKKGFFVTWKSEGATGAVCMAYLGKQYDTGYTHHTDSVAGEPTAFAPVLRVLNNHLYILWITLNGTVKYVINNSDTSFDTRDTYALSLSGAGPLALGITAAMCGSKMVIASHTTGKDQVLAVISQGGDNLLQPATAVTLPYAGTTYPFVVPLGDTAVRLAYKGKKADIYYTDYHLQQKTFSAQQAFGGKGSAVSPAVYSVFSANQLFYIWRGDKKDDRLYYTTSASTTPPPGATQLPAYFATPYPVSICTVDDKKFILSYAGNDHRLYLSYFTGYKTASWMGDLLLTTKPNASLKDIVLPGSHDAGMSVLNGVGGSQSASINECNTLTQTQPIERQLQAGIRMFDLRVGTLRDTLYLKHCSSDCMADAIGGGYGEKLETVLAGIRNFLHEHPTEIVLLTFSHFCERETPVHTVGSFINTTLGPALLYKSGSEPLSHVPLKALAGKVLVNFEGYSYPGLSIDSGSIQTHSGAFINFRRAYAATNDLKLLLQKEAAFFTALKDGTANNDLVRLDWQLTQSSEEAAMVCNDFQDDKTNPVINGAMLLTNIIKKNRSIIDLALSGNKYLPAKLNDWIAGGIVNTRNKPNILYVDAAGAWITDYCIGLNSTELYK